MTSSPGVTAGPSTPRGGAGPDDTPPGLDRGSQADADSPARPPQLVVDASVAIKWYIPEAGSAAAVMVLEGEAALHAPDLLVAELGNILWKKVRRGELAADEAEEIADRFVAACPVTLRPSSPLLRPALELATAFDRTVYDSLYLAVALAEDAVLITADEHLYNALQATRLGTIVRLLGT